jgi:hypothetical protein
MKLLSERELRADSHYFEHNTSKFIQADWQTMVTTLCELRDSEIVSPNEVRKKLNMPKRTDPGGDKYENPHTRPAEASKAKEQKPDKKAHLQLFVDTLNRMARRVGHDARSAAKSPAKFLAWLDGKASDHRAIFQEAVAPVTEAYVSVFGGQLATVASSLETEFFGCLLSGLSPLVEAGHPADEMQANVERELSQFERTAGMRVVSLVLEIEA